MRKRIPPLLMLLLLFAESLAAQSITSLQFPPDIKWKQIETERCILIFDERIEEYALETARFIDSLYPPVESGLGISVSKWPVVLNNTLTISNGYVTTAPRYSELYTMPLQGGGFGNAEWMELLWIHELRHIVQNEKMQQGFTAFAGWIAGEYGWSGMAHFALPVWAWEGDAVLTETLLSNSGRGRRASFERGFRTNLLSGNRYGYTKAVLGSYGDYVPNYYVSGYYLCTYIRRHYGIDAFVRIMDIAARYSFMPLILNIAVKDVTGSTIEELYDSCLLELEQLWSAQQNRLIFTPVETLKTGEEGEHVDYYPLGSFKTGEEGSIAALKTSYSQIYTLVRVDPDGTEKILRKINPIDRNISFNGTAFCWSELIRDIRWGNLSWAAIRIYNPETEEYRLLTRESRYFSPELSPEGNRVAAVEFSEDLESYIVILDSETGRLLEKWVEPEKSVAEELCWTEDGRGIVYIRQHDWQESIRLLDLESGINRELVQPSSDDLESPAAGGDRIFFVSDLSGIENIYAVPADGGTVIQEVSRPFGAASPVPDGSRLLLADYTERGWSIAAAETDGKGKPAAELVPDTHIDYFDPLLSVEPHAGVVGPQKYIEDDISDYTAEDFHPVSGLCNFHSRGLAISESENEITAFFQADDVLNTGSSRIYAGYNTYSENIISGISFAWAGFYPILLGGAELSSPVEEFGTTLYASLYGGIALPFNFSEGIINNQLVLQSVYYLDMELEIEGATATTVISSLYWGYTEAEAERDLQPPLGAELSAAWYYSLDPAWYNFVMGESIIYLPGLFENHGINLEFEAEYNIDSAALLSARNVPRGLEPAGYRVPFLLNGRINYTLPLLYPDLNAGGVIYIKRLYLNAFLDTAGIFSNPSMVFSAQPAEVLQTTGIELWMDFNLFNHYYPLRTGIRFLYDIRNERFRIEDTVLSLGFSF